MPQPQTQTHKGLLRGAKLAWQFRHTKRRLERLIGLTVWGLGFRAFWVWGV